MSDSKTFYRRPYGGNSGAVLHTRRDCPSAKRARSVREVTRHQFPNTPICEKCEPSDADYLNRVEHYREDVHDKLEDTYDYLLRQRCGPSHAAGALRYIEQYLGYGDDITQAEVAEQYDTSRYTLSRWTREAWEEYTGREWTNWPSDTARQEGEP